MSPHFYEECNEHPSFHKMMMMMMEEEEAQQPKEDEEVVEGKLNLELLIVCYLYSEIPWLKCRHLIRNPRDWELHASQTFTTVL